MPVYELHVDNSALLDVVVHPSALPVGTVRGDVIAIRPADVGKGKAKDRPLLYKVDKVQEQDEDPQDSTTAAQISANVGGQTTGSKRRSKAHVIASSTVAQSFSWMKSRQDVFISLVHSPPPTELTACYIELYFKDLYLSRPDMFRLTMSLVDTTVFLNQRVVLPGGSMARLRVGGIFNQEGRHVRSAYIDDETKIVFRSESARAYVFVEISQEMWQFEEDGSMLREKCQVFLHELFAHWTGRMGKGIDVKSKGNATSHTVSIILYGRVIYEDNGEGEEERAPLRRLEDGTLYRDFYKVILDLTPSPSPSIVRTVAAEISSWQESVLTRHRPSGELKLAGRIAFAHESPVLEATNLALNSFEEHWVDRDLQRTGLEIIVLTAGTSYYELPKSLLRLTTERMLYHGIGLDLISLSKTPLHTVPLFAFRSHEPGLSEQQPIQPLTGNALGLIHRRDVMSSASGATSLTGTSAYPSTYASTSSTKGIGEQAPSTKPTTMTTPSSSAIPDDQRDPLYYDSSSLAQPTSVYYAEPMFVFCSFFGTQIDKPHRIDRFMPRARCYQLFSQGPGERIPFAIELLPNPTEYDQETFGDDDTWGYLSEMEKRQRRRDKYDALAVGARGPEDSAVWRRQSGVISGTSLSGVSNSSWGGRSQGAESGAEVEEELARKTTALGKVVGTKRRMARTVSEAIVSNVRPERERSRDRGEQGRGRDDAQRRIASTSAASSPKPSRSRTPGPRNRPGRSASIAGSIRSLASNATTNDANKAVNAKSATPALIARLTSQAADASTRAASTGGSRAGGGSGSGGGGWLGLFSGRGHSSNAAAPAPSVAVQKVEAQANVKAEFDLDGNSTVVLSSRHSSRNTSPASTSRQSIKTASSAISKPTQPISISTRAEQTREADRPSSTRAVGGRAAAAAGRAGAVGSPIMKPNMGHQYTSTSRRSGHKAFTNKFNPSKPGKQSLGLADQARRWASIFIRHSNDQRSVNWVSVTRGACLPLTTDYLPTADSLNSHYTDYRYSVPATRATSSFLLRTDNPGRTPVLELVTELVSQRLSHGFQLVTPANHVGALDEINSASSKTLNEVLHDILDGESTALYLTLSNQIHRVSYDRRTQSVHVKIMRRRRSWLKQDYTYGALVFTQGSRVYSQLNIDFPYPNMIEPNDWQHLDRLVAGVERLDLRPTLRYWRTRLVLLPATTIPDREYIISRTKALSALEGEVTDAMIQDQGFHLFMEILDNVRWTEHGQTKEQLAIAHTTLSAPQWAASVARGAAAAASGASSNVTAQPRTTTSWLSKFKAQDTSAPTTPSIESVPAVAKDEASNGASKKPTVQMSYAVILDLDTAKRSPRSERVLCHLDRSHNVQAAYHLELNWLAGSGKIIEQAIQNWTRQVARFGLTLAEVSVRAVEDRHNPFQKANQIQLAATPPSIHDFDPPLPEGFFESEVLRSLDFILDVGADSTFSNDIDVQYSYHRSPTVHSEYIHRSGALLVAVLGGQEGFAYMPNRIYTSHLSNANTATASAVRPEEPMAALIGLCSNAQALDKLWSQVAPPRREVVSSE